MACIVYLLVNLDSRTAPSKPKQWSNWPVSFSINKPLVSVRSSFAKQKDYQKPSTVKVVLSPFLLLLTINSFNNFINIIYEEIWFPFKRLTLVHLKLGQFISKTVAPWIASF